MIMFSYPKFRKVLSWIAFLAVILALWFGGNGSSAVHAQANRYFTEKIVTLADWTSLDEYIINGPSIPPPGYELERSVVDLPEPNIAAGVNTLAVPAYGWSFGCSATSGAMIAAYYDRNGFPNMYTGPTNGSVMPLDSSSWPNWTDGYGSTYAQCPLIASHQGLDGRATRGSIDDYWVAYNSSFQDPYITNYWVQHTWGDAIGDYMKTSQSMYGNTDGATTFYNWINSTSQLTCSNMESYGISQYDGTYGRKLFYETRGYTVTDCYNQKTDNNGGGFTFAMYKAEIDANRPVFLNLAGHSIVGVGYDSSTDTVYIHDTWDYNTHIMTWGGSYSGMPLLSVSIVNINKASIFTDVPDTYWAATWIERLYNAGITGGCSTNPMMYCPEDTVTRAQMSVFLERGKHGSSYNPPPTTGIFTDVPTSHWAAKWIEQLSRDGITGGCNTGLYCPEDSVTRAQMAVFLLKAEHGSSYGPPAATGIFTDVPSSYWAAKWIEQLSREGITGGCGTGIYCPEDPVTRAQMAIFLVKTFNLP